MGNALAFGAVFVVLILLAIRYGLATQGKKADAEKELFRLCRGDKEMVERLIALEISRGNNKSRERAAKAAAYSFKRDNR